MMKRPIVGIVVAAVAVLATAAGCKSTTTASGSGPTATPPATSTTSATPPAASPTAVATTAAAAPTATGAAAGAAPNPCTLITPADVKTVLAKSVAASTPMPAGVYHVCSYTAANLFIEVRNISKASFDKSASLNPGGVAPVSGIGQDAYSANQSPGGLLAWQNGTEITLFIAGSGDHLAAEKQLAMLAVARL